MKDDLDCQVTLLNGAPKMMHEPLHPGEIVKEACINGTGLSVTQAAKKLGVGRTTVSRLVNGHTRISIEMAVRLSMALHTSIGSWLNLQRDYDEWLAEKARKGIHVEEIRVAG